MSSSEKHSSKGQAWFCTTGLPSDIVVEVDDMTFHLHKFPLMSKSRKLHDLITQQEEATRSTLPQQQQEEDEDEDEIVEEQLQVTFTDFPGGSDAFEMAAKFCYGVKTELSPCNVASLRCAGEFLEMTEDFSEDNLISKTERFLSQHVLRSLGDSIKTLKSCERLMPTAEDLGITERCIDSAVSRASSADPALFGWPVSDAAASASKQVLWNGIDAAGETWFEDLALLSLPLFKRLILAMRRAEHSAEIIETCVMYYARKYIPGVSRSSRKPLPKSSSSSVASEAEQKEILETVISNLPPVKTSKSSTATRFLFGLLRTANILNASESCRDALEKKIGLQLDEATLDDLLVPSYSYLNETLYDVDCVARILSHFLEGLEAGNTVEGGDAAARSPSLMLVGKLIDGYLSEIASDANLKPERFYTFAISLPDQARLFDDGLYRAVDVYLKAHPWVSESEREKICGLLDCQKLTLEACTHAAQNERLPLRAVVQVLFFEQLQLRHAIAETLVAAETAAEPGRHSAVLEREEEEEEGREVLQLRLGTEHVQEGNGTWRGTVRENQVLRLDMDSMRTRVHQLERECSSMKRVIAKIDNSAVDGGGWRASLGRKFSCKFKTQVCDSQQSTVVDKRKGRHHHRAPPKKQQHPHRD
ncbi:BTB/POZ domain-containing protein At5g66560-like [Lotus japonicus]|uniref:BTB/POZ domain-containing protein At5g66560-like n=1 Tax=Lotus japonicus TaxID=34305 RepID=UPI002588B3F2|nr:BTB/POZ domain-containing protein At5g66560-like [Lotus japonicus]XP_057416712.1 BTB/POZ domain-containing protein At5g66560-like [Lotus japonicus]